MLFTVLISTMIARSDNIPPSQMLRVPSALIDAVKELSRLHRSGYTSAVLTGLQQLIASIDSAADSVASVTGGKSDTELLAELISGLDERIATQVAAHVAQLEQRLSTQLEDLKPRDDLHELRSRLAASEQCQQDLMAERGELRQHRDELRSMLDDQATKVEQWYSRASELEQQIEQLQQRQSPLSSPSVAQGEIPDNTPESQAKRREPLVAESNLQESIAIAAHPLEDIPAPAAPSNEIVEGAAPGQRQLTPLTSTELAKRLHVHQSNISRNKDDGNEHFRRWSSERDPDNIAWEYREGRKRDPNFHPLV